MMLETQELKKLCVCVCIPGAVCVWMSKGFLDVVTTAFITIILVNY